MGCDTHMYIEYKRKENGGNYWSSFGGRINPGRNYSMFGIISKGVRYDSDFSFEPKGLPEDMGYKASGDAYLLITDDGDGEGECTLENAESWSKYGRKIIRTKDGTPIKIEHPDWHSHSWLTIDEFEQALTYYNSKGDIEYKEVKYEAMLSAMKTFKEHGYDVRVVFWFDN